MQAEVIFLCDYLYYDYAKSAVCLKSESSSIWQKAASLQSWLNAACLANGSTLEGRRRAFTHLMGQRKFIPVLVSLDPLELYLPDAAIHDAGIRYLSFGEIASIDPVRTEGKTGAFGSRKAEENRCRITFKDGLSLSFEGVRMQRLYDRAKLYIRLLYSSQSSQ